MAQVEVHTNSTFHSLRFYPNAVTDVIDNLGGQGSPPLLKDALYLGLVVTNE